MSAPGLELAEAIAGRLADPDVLPLRPASGSRQQLAYGPAGIALLHIERAARGLGPWERAHAWLATTTCGPITSGPDSHPFYGAPALAHALACAADLLPDAYRRARDILDAQITRDVRRRLDAAHGRIDRGRLPTLVEFDTIRGLAGYGAYLLRRDPTSDATRAVLDYCVRLTEPITHHDVTLPGWWTASGPSGVADQWFPGGHANTGVAHGIGGVLGLLALAVRRGPIVESHHDALRRILDWLDRWQYAGSGRPAWPYWITRDDLHAGRLEPCGSRRPSWCYGTAGLARVQQLAALALGDARRQIAAEHALTAALTDPAQLGATTDLGLCHGVAGLVHIAARAATDAGPVMTEHLRAVIPPLLTAVLPHGDTPEDHAATLIHAPDGGPGLLDGAAGIALALTTADDHEPSRTGWDSCLLIA